MHNCMSKISDRETFYRIRPSLHIVYPKNWYQYKNLQLTKAGRPEQPAVLLDVADKSTSSSLQCCRQSNQQFSSVLQTEQPAVVFSVADRATSSCLQCCRQSNQQFSSVLQTEQPAVLFSVANSCWLLCLPS